MNEAWIRDLQPVVVSQLPRAAMALGVLLVGWVIAVVIRTSVFAALKRTTLDDKVADLLGIDRRNRPEHFIERAVARTVYYILMAFVLVAFFGYLGIDAVTKPLLTLLNGFAGAVPQLLKAVLIALGGFLLASGLRKLVIFALDKSGFEARMRQLSGDDDTETEGVGLSRTLGDVAYWFVIVLAAIPVLEALQIGMLARPLSQALETVTTYLPRVGAAAVLLLVGYVLSRVVRSLVSGLLERVGVDAAIARFAGPVTGQQKLSGILGTVAMVFVLLHFVTSAVGRLQIREVSEPLTLVLQQVYDYLPKLFVGLVLLTVGVFIARMLGTISARLLSAMGFNTLLVHIGLFESLGDKAKAQEEAAKAAMGKDGDERMELLAKPSASVIETPADMAGVALSALVFLLFLRQALGTLQMGGLAELLDGFLGWLPNVLAAVVVVGAALWAGKWCRGRLEEITSGSKDPLVRGTGIVAHVGVVAFGGMVALQQLGVGTQLIAIAFALVLGAVCLALALAFGLGGRDVAGKVLDEEYRRRQQR